MARTTKQLSSAGYRLLLLMTILTLILGSQASQVTIVQAQSFTAPLAATNILTLNVISARTEPRAFGGAGVTKGAAISTFKYIINIDNTGTTDQRSPADGCSPASPGYPDSCKWTSTGIASSSPIYTQGNQDDFAAGLDLPAGRYLISVLADGYKLDGAHFTVPMNGPVTVELQPFPLPDATIRTQVFEDISPTNSAPDMPAEHGLAGFVGHIADYIDFVTTDVYGNPLCTRYEGENPETFEIPASALDADGLPVPIPGSGGQCVSDATGMLAIPHLGPNRYALSVVPPDGQTWIQTTTLEGNHDWDSWVMEGSTGYDTEFVVAGEPFPATFFGFVKPTANLAGGSGTITGTVMATKVYVPTSGGVSLPGTIWGGMNGAKIDKPIAGPWISLNDLQNGDTAVYIGQGNPDGTFTIPNVPDGSYTLTYWDEPQDYILDLVNVTVVNGETADLGVLPLTGWWTILEGHVFNDVNGNGKMDPGEPGLANFPVTMKKRENSVMDRGAITVNTDQDGYYFMENVYPMTQWLVTEAYSDLYYTTGVTYQADNQSEETTVLGAGVDVNLLPIIGLGGRLDWGVKPYAPGTNGGIVGTVSYDTTRNELDPKFAAVENWQPGVSGLTVELWTPVDCGTNPDAACDLTGLYEVDANGALSKGQLINTYVTETWDYPRDCIVRNLDGVPLQHGVDENVLPTEPGSRCLEGPLMGVQFAPMESDQGTPDANFGATVDGNYGFGDGCFNGTLDATDPANPVCVGGNFDPLSAGDYLVHVDIPNDALGRPQYQFTREEDINIFNGDQFVPQVPPPACAGSLHTVDVAGVGTDGYLAVTDPFGDGSNITVPASAPVDNSAFADAGGSVYEGQAKPLCDTKLVTVSNGRSIAPSFNVFTDVPLPNRFWGLIVDDLNFSSDPKSLLYGEKAGVPFAPVGIYDYTNRLVDTIESDYNGLWDVLLPSSNRINCPTPSGVCANLYRFVGNDPGTPGHWNPNYNPQFRTIAAEFEAFPGLIVPADLAPTQVGVTVQLPGLQTQAPVSCTLDSASPQFFAVNKPYIYTNATTAQRSITISGLGFGLTQGTGRVTFDGTTIISVSSWNDRQITFQVPTTVAPGPHQLKVTASSGRSTVNGITFHVVQTGNGGYNPTVFEVGPGKAYATIQSALDAASTRTRALVVVYPGAVDNTNPRYNGRGAYYENLIVASPVKLQGVGPGGVYPDGTPVQGSIVDGLAFGGDTALADAWRTKVASLTWDGNQNVYEGQVIYVLARNGQFTSSYAASIDGFDLRGGDQMGFPNNINQIGGGATGLPPAVETQGGAIFANAYARYLQITNNVVENNGGAFGTIRIGTPNLPAPDTDQQNDNVRIANNRILANAGTNLAGAIGLFAGSENYEVAFNDICGNFSAEYGGGLSVYGYSPNGKIHDNRIYFNRSYDEGGGIIIAGELPADPAALSPGSGPVDIYNNLLAANLANDDGGGLRFLMAGNFAMNVYNNMVVNNVSTHEGGGISLNDAPNVRVYNNTLMKNITTATAITSNGQPAPAGLSTSLNSTPLQASLPGGSTLFSNPLLFNNIFWDNRAGTRAGVTVTGVGIGGAGDIYNWDLGVADGPGLLSPTNTIMQVTTGINPGAGNLGANPNVVQTFDTGVAFSPWRTNPNFVGALLVTADLPPNLMGNYHLLNNTSPAYNTGATSKSGINAPASDIDNDVRPGFGAFDMGADEIRPATADLAITKTDGQATAFRGTPVTYTITVTNLGPDAASGATVVDNLPAVLSGATWSCSASAGSSCSAANGSGNLNTSVSLLNGGSATFSLTATLSTSAGSSLSNTATVSAPASVADPTNSNNSATDTDSVTNPSANLSVTKTDGLSTVVPGGAVQYTIVVSNGGPSAVAGATVNDTMPSQLTGVTWTCTASAGSSCTTTSGSGNISNRTVNLLNGGSATFMVNGTVNPALHGGNLSNTVTVAPPSGTNDPSLLNNFAIDTTAIAVPLPATSILDNFNRANANNLGANWSQVGTGTGIDLRLSSNQAFANQDNDGGRAIWSAASFGANQIAAFTFANNTRNGAALILKASGGSTASPNNYIRVQYLTGFISALNRVVVSTTTNGSTFNTRATFANTTLNNGDRLSAVAYSDGTVNVYRTTAANVTTLIGSVTIPTSGGGSWSFGTGGGRIGIILPQGARVDDFRGGSLP